MSKLIKGNVEDSVFLQSDYCGYDKKVELQ